MLHFCYDVDPFFAFCAFAKSCRHRRGKLVLLNLVLIHEGTPKSERERKKIRETRVNEVLIGITLLI